MTTRELKTQIFFGAITGALLLTSLQGLAQLPSGGIDPNLVTGVTASAPVTNPSREAVQRSRIKAVTVYRYPVEDSGAEGKPTVLSSATYDMQGNLLHQTVLGQDAGGGRDQINRYDERHRILETFNRQPGITGNARMTYDYDAKGHMRELRSYKPDGSVLLSMTYAYNPAGNPTEMAALAGDGRLLYRADCGYAPDGKIASMKVYWDGGKSANAPAGVAKAAAPVLSMVYGYDEKGRPLEQTRFNAQGKPQVRTVWSYDGGPTGPAKTTTYNGQGEVVTELTCSHDGRGRITEEVTAFPAADLKSRSTWRYDANGNPLEKTRYNKLDKPVEIVRYVYVYFGR